MTVLVHNFTRSWNHQISVKPRFSFRVALTEHLFLTLVSRWQHFAVCQEFNAIVQQKTCFLLLLLLFFSSYEAAFALPENVLVNVVFFQNILEKCSTLKVMYILEKLNFLT